MSGRIAPRIWRWPLAIGLASLVGLVSALVGDGWADALSWGLLAWPVGCALYGALPTARKLLQAAPPASDTPRGTPRPD